MREFANATGVADVARRLIAVRQSLALSQRDFADSLGISLRAAQNYEQGERKAPADVLLRLARMHGIDPLWVLEGPEKEPRKLTASRIDKNLISKAQQIVSKAVTESGKRVTAERFAEWVAATYQLLAESGEAHAASTFVATMIRTVK
jgi:transcriptional regulator with XRE-family HTH domain